MVRYSRKDAVTCARRLSKKLKVKQFGECGGKIGCWKLSTNIGGHVIHEIINVGGAVTFPLGSERLTARELCENIEFAEAVLDYKKRKRR